MTFRMRKLVVIALILLCPALAVAAGAFLAEIEDVPLAPGLTEPAGSGIVFDSPSGRIVEATAAGEVSADKIRTFYTETLPQLGWEAVGDLQYRRDNETLKIALTQKGKALTVRFTLTPNNR